MNITELSIKRPAFISSLMIAIITIGYIAFKKMNVELFPNIDIPVIFNARNRANFFFKWFCDQTFNLGWGRPIIASGNKNNRNIDIWK